MNRSGLFIIPIVGIICTTVVAVAVIVTPGNPTPFAPFAIFAETFIFYAAFAGFLKRYDDKNAK